MRWSNPVNIGKYEYRTFRNIEWLKVFYQNFNSGVGFSTAKDALLCNEEDRYSILSELNDSLKLNNKKYEFILYYPELDVYNRWRQTNNPIDEYEATGKTTVDGFHPIHTGAKINEWGGLARSNGTNAALLNGTPGQIGSGSWWLAIGVVTGASFYNSIKTFYNIPAHNTGVNISYLWIRVPLKIDMSCKQRERHHLSFALIALLAAK